MAELSNILARKYKVTRPISAEAANVFQELRRLDNPDLEEITRTVNYGLRELSQYIDELLNANYIEICPEEKVEDWPPRNL
jgi:hypothetical protein